jgi:hypothetical protein
MIKRLWEYLNRSLYVGNWDMTQERTQPRTEDEDWSHYYRHEERIEALKQSLGPKYLCHYSNRIKRVDGKVYGEPQKKLKLRKV